MNESKNKTPWKHVEEDIPELNGYYTRLRNELNRSVGTVTNYVADVKTFAAFLGSREKLINATQVDVRNFVVELLSVREFKATAVRRKLASLRSFFDYLKLDHKRTDNPALDVPFPKREQRLPKVLTETEVTRVLSSHKAGRHEEFLLRNRAILELLYATGMRRSEILGLNVDSLDLSQKTVRVIGKGNKERMVLLNDTAVRALRAYLRVRPKIANPALFISQKKNRLSNTQLWDVFHEAVELSGVGKKASPHVMRHSFATHLLENEVDLMAIKELLGHESLATTQIYTNVSMRHIRRAYDAGHPRDKQVA